MPFGSMPTAAPACPTCLTTTGPPVSTTTTTTAAPCAGTCHYTWSAANKNWTLNTNGCTGAGCTCVPPDYCGGQFANTCEETTTNCAVGGGPPSPYCGSSTTSSTTSTTTSTTNVPCSLGCDWRFKFGRWILTNNQCAANCPCAPPVGAGADCATAHTPCVLFVPPPPPFIPCTGKCQWFWDPDLIVPGWIRINTDSYFCEPYATYGCRCQPPTLPGTPCAVTFTGCLPPGTQPPTSSTTPPPCGKPCVWQWLPASSTWAYVAGCDSGCQCAFVPGYNGTNACETAETPCGTTTTTTSTHPPTTTSTTPPPCGTCSWQWLIPPGAWGSFGANCNSGCGCVVPAGSGSADGDFATTPCKSVTTTTTTTTTTTCPPTTAPPAGTCGTCTWVIAGGQVTFWSLEGGTCGTGCFCFPPPIALNNPPCSPTAGDTATSGCNSTTTTSTTTTTTLPPVCSSGTCNYTCFGAGSGVLNSNSCVPNGAACCVPANTYCTVAGTFSGVACRTTTTAPPTCGTCAYINDGTRVTFNCTGGCSCPATHPGGGLVNCF